MTGSWWHWRERRRVAAEAEHTAIDAWLSEVAAEVDEAGEMFERTTLPGQAGGPAAESGEAEAQGRVRRRARRRRDVA
jgi:hypothetical protein